MTYYLNKLPKPNWLLRNNIKSLSLKRSTRFFESILNLINIQFADLFQYIPIRDNISDEIYTLKTELQNLFELNGNMLFAMK